MQPFECAPGALYLTGGRRPAEPPDTLSRAPLRRRAPFAWLTRFARSHAGACLSALPPQRQGVEWRVMELALRVLIAAALLSGVHARAAAVQENSPPSQAQEPPLAEINALIRQVLANRIPAKDIPGQNLLQGAKRIAIRSDRVRLPLGQEALPALEGYELRLISTEEAQAEAERTRTKFSSLPSSAAGSGKLRESLDWRGLHDASGSQAGEDVLLL